MATDDRALIQIKGAAELREALESKKVAMQHMGNTLHKSVILIDRWIQKNFQTEGQLAYPGKGWQPLAASTIASRLGQTRVKRAAEKKGKSSSDATLKILQQNGWLRNRWKHYWDNRQAIVQSGVDYGIYHDSSEPRKKLPERKILPTEKQIMPELIKIFGKHIETSLDK